MKEQYFIISNSDGDTHVEAVDKETLLERIEEGYYGRDRGVLEGLPKESDTNYWGENILVIKGKIVSPVAEQVVTKYNIE
jgi:hypothetical protein